MRFERWLYTVPLRLRSLFRRGRVEQDLEDELQYHLDCKIDELVRSGMSAEHARRAALRSMDGLAQRKEECRDARRVNLVETTAQDIRYTLRVLAKSPGFTVIAAGTLALAIAANAVVFGLIDAVIFRPVVPRAETLYAVENAKTKSTTLSYPDYIDLRDRNRSFESLAAFNIHQAGLDIGAGPSPIWAVEASGNYFDIVGVRPHLGRFFGPSDERGPGSAPYIVLSHAFWQSRFSADRAVVGRRVLVNQHPYTIIGVAPPGFRGPTHFFSPDLFVPVIQQAQVEGREYLEIRDRRWLFMVVGHLRPGISSEQAAADLNAIGSYLGRTYPDSFSGMTFGLARPTLFGNLFDRPIKAFLGGLMLLSALILAAACVNLGSLFAARAADRSREVALRLALGAGQIRIMRHLFTEAFVIAVIGGGAGLAASVVLLRALSASNPLPRLPVTLSVNPDANVYAVTLLLTLASAFLFGAVPVRQVLRTAPYEVLKSGLTGSPGRRLALRDAMLVAQIAICGILVTACLVAVRGLVRSLETDFGFDPQGAIVLETTPGMAGYRDDAVPRLQRRLIDAVQALPAVASAGLIDRLPLAGGTTTTDVFTAETTDLRASNAAANVAMYSVSPGYLEAAGTTLLEGRAPSWHDDEAAPSVAVINREFARRVFGAAADVVGRHFKQGSGRLTHVVGVVEDGRYRSLTEDPRPAMFLPILQAPVGAATLVVRPRRDPQAVASALPQVMLRIDPRLPYLVDSWFGKLELVLFPSRAATVALGILGALGAMLSLTGVFGMAAYSVSRRMRELGIRVALGARRKQVLEAALGRPLALLSFGSAAGLLLGILASRVLAALVYQATPRDPVVIGGVIVTMLLLGLLATWIPAQRALSLDPVTLLRED